MMKDFSLLAKNIVRRLLVPVLLAVTVLSPTSTMASVTIPAPAIAGIVLDANNPLANFSKEGNQSPYPKVSGLQGKPLSNAPPAVGQILKWNGSAWKPANENAAGGSTYNAGIGLSIQGSNIYANNTQALWNASKLQGNPVANTTPTMGYVLKWNGSAWEPAADNVRSVSQTPTIAKPSLLLFTQSNLGHGVFMDTRNVDTAPIGGFDNQSFSLAQSFLGVDYNKNNPSPPTLVFSSNEQKFTRR